MHHRTLRVLNAFILVLVLSHSVGAQTSKRLQVRVGANISSMESSPITLGRLSGFQCAMALEFLQTTAFSMQIELEYARRGYSDSIAETDGVGSVIAIRKANTSLNYISVPLLCRFRYYPAKVVVPYLLVGPRLEFLAWRQLGVYDFTSLTVEDELAKAFRDVSVGFSLGIGISIAKASRREFRVEVRQNFGLTDLMPQSSAFTVKNRSVDLSFALLL